MFADDLNIFRRIDSFAECLTLRGELNALALWFDSIGLQFNTDKCKPMSFTTCCSLLISTYSINSSCNDVVTTEKNTVYIILFGS